MEKYKTRIQYMERIDHKRCQTGLNQPGNTSRRGGRI